jgi:tRNA(Ile)-lysidine synthase
LERAVRRLQLPGRGLLLAVSGGADSLAMLHALARLAPALALRLEVATVDHGLHPDASLWATGVERASTGLRLTCHRVALHLELDGDRAGLEATARDARYAALERVRQAAGLDLVATAHTASDQAETLLMRLVRGAALGGAGGILEARGDRVVRPLLFASRADVESYLAALALVPVRDPMNEDGALLRTRIRRGALPALAAAAGFDVQPALARFARLAWEDDALLSAEARRAFERCALDAEALDRVAVNALALPIRRRVVALLLERAGLPLDAASIDEALEAIARGSTATLPRDALLACANGRVRVEPAPPRRAS